MFAVEYAPEAPAIRALGPLFKITEVFLWDDSIVSNVLAEEPTSSCTTVEVNSSIKHTINDYTSVEDFELAQQMDALGLPISFSTTKEKKNVVTKGKRKEMQVKSVSSNKNIEIRVPGVLRVGQWEDIVSSRVLQDSTNIPACGKTAEGEIEASYHNVVEDHGRGDVHSDGQSFSVDATVSEIGKNQVGDEIVDVVMSSYVKEEFTPADTEIERSLEHSLSSDRRNFPGNVLEDARSGVYQEGGLFNEQVQDNYLEDSSLSCHITGATNDGALNSCPSSIQSSVSCASVDHHIPDYPDNSVCCEFGDWRVVWDPFYKRNYFYNFQSQESTWYPPSGLAHLAYSCSISDSNEMFADAANEDAGIGFACDAIQDKDLHGICDRTNLFQENGNDFECINRSSEEISSKVTNGHTVIGSEHSDEHATVSKIADKRNSLHVKDHATDDMGDSEYLERQEKNVTYCEAWSVPDVPLKLPLSDSLTTTLNEVDCDENRSNSPETCVTSVMDELDSHKIATKKKKKRVRRPQSQLTWEGLIRGLSANIVKYWCQRYLLFSRFDYGIKLDEEGWFSVTPEPIARHHASRCGSGTLIDCFTGVGGNAIQFAVKCNHVIAIDIDPQKIEYAQHNAAIYEVNNRIDFVKGDFFQIAPRLKGDVIFMSPPWGGPDYNKVQTYDIRSMLKPHDGHYLFKIARTVASKVVMFLPRNVDLNQLAELSLSVNPPWALEVEKNFLNGKLKAITAYFENPTI